MKRLLTYNSQSICDHVSANYLTPDWLAKNLQPHEGGIVGLGVELSVQPPDVLLIDNIRQEDLMQVVITLRRNKALHNIRLIVLRSIYEISPSLEASVDRVFGKPFDICDLAKEISKGSKADEVAAS